MKSAQFLKDMYSKFGIRAPKLHCVLGSGLSDALNDIDFSQTWEECGEISFTEIPAFTATTAPGHPGKYKLYKHKSGEILSLQLGRLHGYEGLEASEVVKSVTQIYDAGTKVFLLTNAAGSLNPDFKPGSVMLIEDHVNFTGRNPLVGENKGSVGQRFPDLSSLYNKELGTILEKSLSNDFSVHRGTYIGVLGPSFETPAEVKLFEKWGMGAVGMSTVWEAIALKHRGAQVCGLSFMSNYGCGLIDSNPLSHEDVLEQGRVSALSLVKGILSFAERTFENGI